jgi:hypothetical protein
VRSVSVWRHVMCDVQTVRCTSCTRLVAGDVCSSSCKVCDCQMSFKQELGRRILVNIPAIKYQENPFIWSRVVPCGQTDMTKSLVTFRNFFRKPRSSVKQY